MVNEKYIVEDTYKPLVKQILGENSFSNVKEMPRNALFDFIATKDEKLVFIEAKSRSPQAKTQNFVLTWKKIDRLIELEKKTGNIVYLFFINRTGHKIVPLKDFLDQKADMSPMEIHFSKEKDTGSFIVWNFNPSTSKWKLKEKEKSEQPKTRYGPRVKWKRVKKNDLNFIRHFYKYLPYDEIIKEFKLNRAVFIEEITRQTAHFAADKLTRILGKKVIYGASLMKTEKDVLRGYLFTVEEKQTNKNL